MNRARPASLLLRPVSCLPVACKPIVSTSGFGTMRPGITQEWSEKQTGEQTYKQLNTKGMKKMHGGKKADRKLKRDVWERQTVTMN